MARNVFLDTTFKTNQNDLFTEPERALCVRACGCVCVCEREREYVCLCVVREKGRMCVGGWVQMGVREDVRCAAREEKNGQADKCAR